MIRRLLYRENCTDLNCLFVVACADEFRWVFVHFVHYLYESGNSRDKRFRFRCLHFSLILSVGRGWRYRWGEIAWGGESVIRSFEIFTREVVLYRSSKGSSDLGDSIRSSFRFSWDTWLECKWTTIQMTHLYFSRFFSLYEIFEWRLFFSVSACIRLFAVATLDTLSHMGFPLLPDLPFVCFCLFVCFGENIR